MDRKFQPEIIFGLVGPIGVNLDEVQQALSKELRIVDYTSSVIHLTKVLPSIASAFFGEECKKELETYDAKIDYANKLRTKSKKDELLAAVAVLEIDRFRKNKHEADTRNDLGALKAHAFIIRQLKRKEELSVLRQTYGKRFVQISVVLDTKVQLENLGNRLAKEDPSLTDIEREDKARKLIETDKDQKDDDHGQRFSEAFHSGDVFISGNSDKEIQEGVRRFISAFFGKNEQSPSIDEFGSYIAKGASLRSADLSRQVGSAILNPKGDLITIGFNDVPKSSGGNYWYDDEPKHRDIDDKYEPNKVEMNRIIADFLKVINKCDHLKGDPGDIQKNPEFQKAIKKALVSNITEYGRMTHAEMTALCDAARLGRSVDGATIYVTTYPCHNCAKHLIASGIKRIVFIEPYPKSKALASHKDALTEEKGEENKVKLEHFVGISPRRYRDVFEKGKRRDAFGEINEWYKGYPSPHALDAVDAYMATEKTLLKSFFPQQSKKVK